MQDDDEGGQKKKRRMQVLTYEEEMQMMMCADVEPKKWKAPKSDFLVSTRKGKKSLFQSAFPTTMTTTSINLSVGDDDSTDLIGRNARWRRRWCKSTDFSFTAPSPQTNFSS